MKTAQKITFILVGLFLIGTIGILFFLQNATKQATPDPILGAFKSGCEVYDQSPYQDPVFDFRVTFADDQVVCLLKNDSDGVHDVYIWEKEAFEATTLNGTFNEIILGKISMNSHVDFPESHIVDKFSIYVDGEFVEGDIITSPSCTMEDCPRAKRVVLQRFGKTISLEQYSEQFNLFDQLQF